MMCLPSGRTPRHSIGHVTKRERSPVRGSWSIVDTVLSFEGDRGRSYRVLRSVKNRFGSTNEIVFLR